MAKRRDSPEGRLRIGPAVAYGGMGVIHQGTDDAGRIFAVKYLTPAYATRPAILKRFLKAATVQFNLDHPNIVPVYKFHKDPTLGQGVVMKWISGVPLDEELEGGHPPPWNLFETMAVMKPLLEAVAAAHDHGVVHRDLKPGNVLLEAVPGQGWPGTPCLIDFDLVKLTGKEVQSLTRDGTMMGTPPYMAPEQYMAARNVDERADVFALGIIFRQLLTGILPVNPNNQVALTRVYSGERPIESLGVDLPRLSPAVVAVLDAAISIDPTGRPRHARVLLEAVLTAMAGGQKYPSVASLYPEPSQTQTPAFQPDRAPALDLEYDDTPAHMGQWMLIIFGLIAAAMFLASINAE